VLSETDELGSSVENGRSAAIWEECNGRAENGELNLWSDFNRSYRNDDGSVGCYSFNLAMRDGDDGTIVVIGNSSTVQPRVQRRIVFGYRHEQPQRKRQNTRRHVKTLARSAIYFISELHFSFQTKGIKAAIAPKPAAKFASWKL